MANECTLWTKDGKLIKNSEGKLILSRSCPCTPQMCKAYYIVTDVPDSAVTKTCSGVTKSFITRTHGLYIIDAAERIPSGGSQVGGAFVCGEETKSYTINYKQWTCPAGCDSYVKDVIDISCYSDGTYTCPDGVETETDVSSCTITISTVASTKEDGGFLSNSIRDYTFSYARATGCVTRNAGVGIDMWVTETDNGVTSEPINVTGYDLTYCCDGPTKFKAIKITCKERFILDLTYFDDTGIALWDQIGPYEAGEIKEYTSCFEGGYNRIAFCALSAGGVSVETKKETKTITITQAAGKSTPVTLDNVVEEPITTNENIVEPQCSWSSSDKSSTLSIADAKAGYYDYEDIEHEVTT